MGHAILLSRPFFIFVSHVHTRAHIHAHTHTHPTLQIIFGFPKDTYRTLLSLVPVTWVSERVLFKLTNNLFLRPGTVMDLGKAIPEIVSQLPAAGPGEEVTSRAGNVHDFTGYYL